MFMILGILFVVCIFCNCCSEIGYKLKGEEAMPWIIILGFPLVTLLIFGVVIAAWIKVS